MLRTTISRIKKVCTVPIIPRVLRGDQRSAPVSYAVVRIAQKSTKPPDDSDQATTDKRNDGASYVLTSGEEIKTDEKDKKRPLSHHERCKRIIDQAFGSVESTDDPDHVQSEQYCSHTVNIEETKREIVESEKASLKLKESAVGTPIVPDDRTQYGIFKMSRELIFEDVPDPTDDVTQVKEPPEIRTSTVRVVREPDLSRNLENMEKTQEAFKQNVEKAHEAPKHLGPPTLEEEALQREENKALCEEDAAAMELLKEKYLKHHVTEHTEDTPSIVNATTTKEAEQKLAQKLEQIEETPLVEAEKPKIEGFNTPPQVLGDTKPTYHTISNDSNMQQIDDYSDAIDQVASRCLQSPVGKIDEMLINEMENLDIRSNCNTGSKSPAMDLEDDLVQMNESKEQSDSEPLKDDHVGMCPRSVELTRDVGAILPNVGEQTDEVVLKSHENLLVKNELIYVTKDNTEDVSAKQNISGNAAIENASNEVIKPSSDNVEPIEPQSIVSESSRLQNNMSDTELPPLKLHKQKIIFRNKKSANPDELPLKSDFVIDDVMVKKISEHGEQSSPEGNDAKVLSEEQKMNENLHQLHMEATDNPGAEKTPAELDNNPQESLLGTSKAIPENSKIPDDPFDDEPLMHETQTSSERKKKERDIVSHSLSNQINNAEELPINVEHVNIVGSRIAPHDPYFLDNIKREISAPLSLTEPTVGRVEEQRNEEVLHVESVEAEVENPDRDSISSHNLTFTNSNDFELIKDQSELQKQLQEAIVPTQQATVNKLFSKIPFSNFRLPNSKWSHMGKRSNVEQLPNPIHQEKSAIEAPHTVNTTGKAILPNEVLRQSDMACMNSVKPGLAYKESTNQKAKASLDEQSDIVVESEELNQLELDLKPNETCTNSQGPDNSEVKKYAFKNVTELVVDDEYNENRPAKPSLDEQANLVMKSEELEPEPELDLECKEASTDTKSVHAYAFKKGTELIDDDNAEDFQAKRSLDYDLVMDSEKLKHHELNLMSKETCATSPKAVGLGDIALAYEQGSNIVDRENNNIHYSPAEENNLVPDLMTDETAHSTTASPEQENLGDMGYSYDKGTILRISEDVEDYPAKRSLDDMVMEFESPPRAQGIQTIIHVQPIVDQMPSLNEDVALSELLRRVRQRSRLMAFNNDCKTLAVEVVPVEAKCPRRAPRCPPTAPRSPPNNPIPPPSFGLPMLKRRPPACKPKRKPNTTNCSTCDLSKLCGVQIEAPQELNIFFERDEAYGLFVRSSEADLTEVVIDRLQTLGRTLTGVLRQVKSQVETMFARDYEPWVPIPSWPHTKKVDKPKVQPGYHGVPPCITGCPVFPKANISRNPEPRCYPRPCDGFPKRTFSMLDCFAVSLGENQVYDLGQF